MATISERASAGIRDMSQKDIDDHKGRNRLVSDDQVGDALRWLASNAAEIGEARARLIRAGHMLKYIEALQFLASSEKTVEAKKFDVRTSQKWLDAAEEEALAAGDFEKMKALREAAMARVEAWRTESASMRGRP